MLFRRPFWVLPSRLSNGLSCILVFRKKAWLFRNILICLRSWAVRQMKRYRAPKTQAKHWTDYREKKINNQEPCVSAVSASVVTWWTKRKFTQRPRAEISAWAFIPCLNIEVVQYTVIVEFKQLSKCLIGYVTSWWHRHSIGENFLSTGGDDACNDYVTPFCYVCDSLENPDCRESQDWIPRRRNSLKKKTMRTRQGDDDRPRMPFDWKEVYGPRLEKFKQRCPSNDGCTTHIYLNSGNVLTSRSFL